jgi:hypothetical protein
MARKPLIPPGSVLPAHDEESVLGDVLARHRRRKGLDDNNLEEQDNKSESLNSNLLESKNSDKSESLKEIQITDVPVAEVTPAPTVASSLEKKIQSATRVQNGTSKGQREAVASEPTTTAGEDLIERAIVLSTRPDPDLTPWGTRLPRALKKRLDYQAYRLKENKVSGQGLTILALERLLIELEAQEANEQV